MAKKNQSDSAIDIAKSLVYGERAKEYGDAAKNFQDAATIASITTGKPLSAEDVVNVLIAVKLAREAAKQKRDNIIDSIGYLEILDRIIEKNEVQPCK